MLRVTFMLMLLASWPAQAARGTVPGTTPHPASPQNRAPLAVGYIDAGPLYAGGSPATINASSYFSDPDGDTLRYSVNSPSPAVVTVTISGSTITVAPVGAGSTGKIVVTATDPGGLTATQDFTATVEERPPPPPPPPVNGAPVAVGYISDVTLREGGSPTTINVAGKFSDPDGDTLRYSVNSPSPTVVSVTISGSTVTVTPAGAGSTGKIVVTATDPGGLTATQDFTATVEERPPPPPPPSPVNGAPVAVGYITDVTLGKGGTPTTINVTGKFSDPDGDTLRYSVNSPSPTVVSVTVSGSTVTVTPAGAGSTGKIVVTATDPGGLAATQDFTASVVNNPPRSVEYISNVTLYKKGKTRRVSVSGTFSDPDGDTLTYSASSSDSDVATASTSRSDVIVRSGQRGTATITVTATDTDGATGRQRFNVTVVNRSPQPRGSISKVTLHRGQDPQSVDVSGYFDDPDDDRLAFTASSSDSSVAAVGVSGDTVTITSGNPGNATITVAAEDNDRASATQTISVAVINRAPEIVNGIANVHTRVGDAPTRIDVSSRFSDADGDTLGFSAESSNPSAATVDVSGVTLAVTPLTTGATTITVTATDSGNLAASLTFTVTVAGAGATNQPPEVLWTIPDQPLERGGTPRSVMLSSKFSDPDDEELVYSASSSDTTVATVHVSGSTMMITPGANGTSTVTVVATDPGGLTASQNLTATVSRAPVSSGTLPTLELGESMQSRSVDVASRFSDPDGETLSFEATSSDTGIATATARGSAVTVSRVSPGTALVWVAATDPGGLTALLSMTIRVANRPPATAASIGDQTLYLSNAFPTVDLTDKFSDPDGTRFAYTASSSNERIATVTAGGSTLQIRPVARGTTTVTVRATDPGNLFVEQTFDATVANQHPRTVEPPIGNRTLYMQGGSLEIDATLYFTDPDGEGLSYSVVSPDPGRVAASVVDGKVVLRPVSPGSSGKIVVTARDPGGLTANQDFNVTVVPGEPPVTTPSNRAPVAQGTLTVDNLYLLGPPVAIDVTPYFTDPDGDGLSYTVVSKSPGIVAASVVDGSIILRPVSPGSSGKVVVTVRDPVGLTVVQDFNVAVVPGEPPVSTPTNQAPVAVGTISVDTLYAEGPSVTIDATPYFTDPDGDILTYSVTSPSPGIVEASGIGSEITLRPVGAGSTDKILVTARDPGGLTAVQDFNVEVAAGIPPEPVNNAPEIRKVLTDRYVTVGGGTVTLNVAPYFLDPDGDPLKYELNAGNAGVATVTLADGILSINPIVLGDSGKNLLRAIDPAGLYVEQDFVVFVVRNLAPETLRDIPDQALTVAGGPLALDLSSYFSDPDLDSLTYAAVSSNTGAVTAAVIGDTSLTVTPVEKDMSSTVTVTASDGQFSVVREFDVTVNNSPPQVSAAIPDLTTTVAAGSAHLNLPDHFADADGDALTYKAGSSNTLAATATVGGDTLTVTPRATGGSTLEVSAADDDSASVAQSFAVTVEDERPPPPPPPPPLPAPCPAATAGASIPDQTLVAGAGTTRIELAGIFEHIGGGGVVITVASPNPDIAATAIEGTGLKIDPKSTGRISGVTVTVADTARPVTCAPASLSFTITVENPFAHPWSVSDDNVYRLAGNVGVGVTDPELKLVVDGKIRASEYRLTMNPADYVFVPDYDLMSLEEVARYIRDHGHLPGVPSGAETRAGGIGISRMQTTILAKIEELSLHVIAQHEELLAQGHGIDALRRRLRLQDRRIRRLDHRLERLEQ